MTREVFITPAALKDLQAAIDYYNQSAAGLGDKFGETIASFIEKIAENPFASAKRYKEIRCKPVIRFPYLILFVVDEVADSIQILRIFNTHQEPLW
jgi:plasmid stabilization system protein ParE